VVAKLNFQQPFFFTADNYYYYYFVWKLVYFIFLFYYVAYATNLSLLNKIINIYHIYMCVCVWPWTKKTVTWVNFLNMRFIHNLKAD